MTTTATVGRWLRSLPHDDAKAILDAATRAAASLPQTSANVKLVGPALWQVRTGRYRDCIGMRHGDPVILCGSLKHHDREQRPRIRHARKTRAI